MKSSAQQWLTGRASPQGMLACGMRGPDGKFICNSLDTAFPTGKMEKVLVQFQGLRQQLFPEEQAPPRWSTWSFEQGRIRLVARPDGWLLGLVARGESEAVPRFDPLSEEFLSLEF